MASNPIRKKLSADDLLGDIDAIGRELVTESELAAFWAVTPRQVSGLASEGAIEKYDSRRFDRQDATRGYIRKLIKQANHRTTADPELRDEKLRLAKEQADKLEISNAESRRELVSAKSVEHAWTAILRDVRAGMLAVPGRLQSQLPHLTAHDVRTIELEIKSALKELADGND